LFRLLFEALVLTVLFTAQWHMVRTVLSAFERRRPGRDTRLLRSLLPAVALLMAAGYLLGFTEVRSLLPFTSPLVAIFSGAVDLWLITTSCMYGLYLLARLALRRLPPFDPGRRRLVNTAGGVLLASPLLVAGYGALIERTKFGVREVDVPVPGLHPDLEGLRLLQLTDIHLSAFLSAQDLEGVIHDANETKPHLAFVTGDMISMRGDPLDVCLHLLSTVKSDSGIWGCLGNHEHYSDAERYAAEQGRRLGIRMLREQHAEVRFGAAVINIAGVDYQPMSPTHTGYLRGAERMVVPGAFNVLLSHNPDVFPIAAAQGYDLTVAGHTHGGQVNIEILRRGINPARFFTPYVHGLYQLTRGERRASAYVSRGIGTIGIPARVGAPPEITLMRLRKA
jgi:predicted MPP superfamily phosphohydrolase